MRYLTLNTYFKNRFNRRVQKISLDAGLTCPNRDGAISDRGCIFCDEKGSGTGAFKSGLSLTEQLQRAQVSHRYKDTGFIAYFQSFTNTYAPLEQLREMWETALAPENVIGLSVGTRPDCLEDETVELLASYTNEYEVWLELGLQSASDRTLELINRGHTASDFARTVERVKGKGLKILAHVIIGLPGEGEKEILDTAGFVTDLGLDGVKIHSLYVPEGTELAAMHEQGRFSCQSQDEYVALAVKFLENISENMIVHRLTGDPDPSRLVAPQWSLDKHRTLALIRERLEKMDTWQGKQRGAGRPAGNTWTE